VDKATADEYAVSLYYELDVGNAGFAASFQAINNLHYSPRELGNVREVKLAGGITGFFRPVSCGGSCAPANLWWEQGAVLYQIQLKLPSTVREKNQEGISNRTHARYYELRPDYLGSVRRFTETLAQHQPYSAVTAYSAL
jgi:hypothetical protein